MIFLVIPVVIPFLLGFGLQRVANHFDLKKQHSKSSLFLIFSPLVAMAVFVFALFLGGTEGELVGSSSPLSGYVGSFVGSFVLSWLFVKLYRVKWSSLYVGTSTVIHGLAAPGLLYLFSYINTDPMAVPGGLVIVLIPLLWSLIFSVFTAGYIFILRNTSCE